VRITALLAIALLAACARDDGSAPVYESAAVTRASVSVSVGSSGVVEPLAIVEVKSKASGEVLELFVTTGDYVEEGALLVRIDPRTVRNRLAQAGAALKAAKSRLQISVSQMQRAERLVKNGTLTEADYEQAALELANAESEVVSAEVDVENARIAVDDTDIRAPVAGTVIMKPVEKGQVISSPTQDFAGGTLLMSMADLSAVQIRAMIDETDIGKVRQGMRARVTVAAYPNQPFAGEVLKIEPQAVVDQNVTMFAVLVSLGNPDGLLLPGMNAEVEISVAARDDVLVVPIMALRTERDVPATAAIIGMNEADLRSELSGGGARSRDAPAQDDGTTMSIQGRTVELPAGIDAASVRSIMEKRRSGASLTAAEQQLLRRVFAAQGEGADGMPGSRGRADDQGTDYRFGGDFWVVVDEGDGATRIAKVRAGLTDLDKVEIVSGLREGDRVLILPSAHLVETQEQLQSWITRRVGTVPGLGSN
jgi:HlyD family secretion protein